MIAIIEKVMIENDFSEIFNIVCDNQISRKEFYQKEAIKLGIEPPLFNNENSIFKKVNNQKLKKKLNIKYFHNFFD